MRPRILVQLLRLAETTKQVLTWTVLIVDGSYFSQQGAINLLRYAA
jgi:hypothetical protein